MKDADKSPVDRLVETLRNNRGKKNALYRKRVKLADRTFTRLDLEETEKIEKNIAELRASYIQTSNKYTTSANSATLTFSGQLILVTTVIITINVLALGNSDLLKALTYLHKVLLMTIFSLQCASIAAGIINYQNIRTFYKSGSSTFLQAARTIKDRKYSSYNELTNQIRPILEPLEKESKLAALNLQIICIVLSLFLYAIFYATVLFSR